MAGMTAIMHAAESALAAQENELAVIRSQQTLLVLCRTATGSGNIDHIFSLDRAFRLVFVRCHFTGTTGKNVFTLSADSLVGPAYDARLFVITRAGTNGDVNFRVAAEESAEPSPWTFQVGDALRIQWTNPSAGNITWGLEVGLAMVTN